MSKQKTWTFANDLLLPALAVGMVLACIVVGVVGLARNSAPPRVPGKVAEAYAAGTALPTATQRPPSPIELHLQAWVDAEPTMSTMGSSFAQGTGASVFEKSWLWGVRTKLASTRALKVEANGFPGATAPQLLDVGISPLMEQNPAVIFYEPGTPNNYRQSVPLDEVQEGTVSTLERLRAELPNTFIVAILDSPPAGQGPNLLGLDYRAYINADTENLSSADAVCDVYSSFPQDNLGKYLSDGFHPGDDGHVLWTRALNSCLGLTS